MKLRLRHLALLAEKVKQAANNPEIGFEDADHSKDQINNLLDRIVDVPQAVVESALWSCVMLDEKELWNHPEGLSLPAFIKTIAPQGTKFNYELCLFQVKND